MFRSSIVNNEQRDGPNPLSLYLVKVSGAIKLLKCLPVFDVLFIKKSVLVSLRGIAKH